MAYTDVHFAAAGRVIYAVPITTGVFSAVGVINGSDADEPGKYVFPDLDDTVDYSIRVKGGAEPAGTDTTIGLFGKRTADAIKTKTDQLTFTLANQVDANAITGGGGGGGSFGPGSVERSILIRDNSGNPLANAEVWARTVNSSASPVVWSGTSNDVGLVMPWLDAGTYYFWISRSGFVASNPYTVTLA